MLIESQSNLNHDISNLINKTALVILSGGQGSRLNFNGPKGSFLIPKLGKSLYKIHLERIHFLERAFSKKFTVFFMTSKFTFEKSFSDVKNFAEELKIKSKIGFFNQSDCPVTNLENNSCLFRNQKSIITAPNGNGGLFESLKKNIQWIDGKTSDVSVIDYLRAGLFDFLNVVSVDNILCRFLDEEAIKILYERKLQILNKAVQLSNISNTGIFREINGKIMVEEYSERDSNRSGLSNICNHYFSIKALHKIIKSARQLPVHRAIKKIPHFDRVGKEWVEPKKKNGIKFELFIFDAFNFFKAEDIFIMEVNRKSEFSPIKNADPKFNEDPVDCPITARNDYLSFFQH